MGIFPFFVFALEIRKQKHFCTQVSGQFKNIFDILKKLVVFVVVSKAARDVPWKVLIRLTGLTDCLSVFVCVRAEA